MRKINVNAQHADLLGLLNQASSAGEMAELLKSAGVADPAATGAALFASRMQAGGAFRSVTEMTTSPAVPFAAVHSLVEAVEKSLSAAAVMEPERKQFRSLLLMNPNYFGTLKDSVLQPVKPMQGNTSYEQLMCVGLNTPIDRLEAVVQVKKTFGYSGGICSNGSVEYVRFFVDLHDDGNFHDVGLGSVRVYDLPGRKPLCYAVYKDFSPVRKYCTADNVVRVRAILSWHVPTLPNAPNDVPVWGNVLDVSVQIRPKSKLIFVDFLKDLELAQIKLPDPIGPVAAKVPPEAELPLAVASPLTVVQRKQAYQRAEVPAHRFAYPEASQFLHASTPELATAVKSKLPYFEQLGLTAAEIAEIIKKINNPGDGDTSYEELNCVGLKPEKDMLEAVFTVKKKFGYSGSLCSQGSKEYVAFWMDFSDGAGWRYMGTASVIAHDVAQTPATGIKYAVKLGAKLAKFKMPCGSGARVAKVRAVLSWETPPPPANPNWTPVWGNREECLVQLDPSELTGHTPVIDAICSIPVEHIDPSTGRTLTGQSPFGGYLAIIGRILNPPDSLGGGAPNFKYKIEVAPDGTSDWQPLLNDVGVTITESVLGVPTQCAPGEYQCGKTLTAKDDGDGLGPGWYTYYEDLSGIAEREVIGDVLGYWYTNQKMEGLWQIRLTAKDPSTTPPTVYNGFEIVKVRIDNTAPAVNLTLDTVEIGGTIRPAKACEKFPKGAILRGTFSVSDPGTVSSAADYQHHNRVTFEVLPAGPANGAMPTTVPANLDYPAAPTTGVSGTWELKTAAMDPCGYVLRINGYDRTIVNCDDNFWSYLDTGFCLER